MSTGSGSEWPGSTGHPGRRLSQARQVPTGRSLVPLLFTSLRRQAHAETVIAWTGGWIRDGENAFAVGGRTECEVGQVQPTGIRQIGGLLQFIYATRKIWCEDNTQSQWLS